MFPGSAPPFLVKTAKKLLSYLLHIELSVLVVLLVGYFVMEIQQEIGEAIISLGAVTLALVYYILALLPGETKFDVFLTRLTYFSYTITIVAILFTSLQWPGAPLVFPLAQVAIALSIVAFFILVLGMKKVNPTQAPAIIRSLVFLAVIILLQVMDPAAL